MYKSLQPKTTNFFDQFSNPSGGYQSNGGKTTSGPVSIRDLLAGMQSPQIGSKAPVSNTQGAAPGSIRGMMAGPITSQIPGMHNAFQGGTSLSPGGAQVPTPQPTTGGGIFSQGGAQQEMPQGGQPPATQGGQVPQQWMNSDGSMKTPEEIVQGIEQQMQQRASGDIGAYAADQFNTTEKTAEQLANEARQLSNAQGDLASGETDPYGIASESGVAYSPDELKAIENAAAGIYDPALTTAISKLEAKKKSDDEAKKWEQTLQELAIKHDYDIQKMKMDQSFQRELKSMEVAAKAAASASAGASAGEGGMSPYLDERTGKAIGFIDQLLVKGGANKGIFGRTAALPIPESMRSDAFRDYNSLLDSLKSTIAFGELTAMREASKTGGALGNVSNIELALLESSSGPLKMSQSPETALESLKDIQRNLVEWRARQKGQMVDESTSYQPVIIQAPDGRRVEIID